MLAYSTRTIGLVGSVWTTDGREQLQTLVIEKGKIIRVIEGKGDLSGFPGIVVIELDAETVIFPGLLNLHTHIGYNILPIWESHQVWKNRFQWRNNAGYKAQIGGLVDYIKSGWTGDTVAQAIISEIQAVAGGTTVIQETLDLDTEQADDRSFIIRNTGDQADLPIPAADQVNSVVDFYRPNVMPSGDSTEE